MPGANVSRLSDAKEAHEAEVAYEMQRQGFSLRDIGAHLGISHETVRRRITAYCEQLVLPKAEEYRTREVERCDWLIERMAPKVAMGDPQAASTTLRAMERKAKLLGLDMPTRVDATVVQVTQEDVALMELMAEARTRTAYNSSESGERTTSG